MEKRAEEQNSTNPRIDENSYGSNFVDHTELLKMVGDYGRFQKIVNLMFCITIFPSMYPLMIMYFSCNTPSWRCKANSSICISNKTFAANEELRCSLPKTEWEYTKPIEYSLVTQYNIDCERKWLIEVLHSILFLGFMFGAVIVGWFSDNYGRKRVHYASLGLILTLGFLCIFSPNVYFFIACRFVIGLFMHGTFPQIFVMISEIVGNKRRVFANNIIIASAAVALSLLALKAYFIDQWKYLYIACSLPYIFVLSFSLFVPQSIRFLSIKGKLKEAFNVFSRIAKWNKKTLPSNLSLTPTVVNNIQPKSSSPIDLFRTRNMLTRSLIQGYAFLILSMTFYSLYLVVGDLSGHMYRDYFIVTIVDVPVLIATNYSLQKYGRKTTTRSLVLLASSACIALGCTVKKEDLMTVKVVLGVIGKCFVGGIIAAMNIWSVELYPTNIRVQGLAFLQIMDKIGSTMSIWIVKELSKVYKGLPFFVIGGLSMVTFILLRYLPEMEGKTMQDDIDEAGEDNIDIPQISGSINETKCGWNISKYFNSRVKPIA